MPISGTATSKPSVCCNSAVAGLRYLPTLKQSKDLVFESAWMALKHNEPPAYELRDTPRSADPFVCMVGATRTPMVVTNPNLPDNPIIYANAALLKMTGYEESEILGKNCCFLQGPATDPSPLVLLRAAIDARTEAEVDLLNYRKDGTKFWNRLLVTPVFDEGKLAFL